MQNYYNTTYGPTSRMCLLDTTPVGRSEEVLRGRLRIRGSGTFYSERVRRYNSLALQLCALGTGQLRDGFNTCTADVYY